MPQTRVRRTCPLDDERCDFRCEAGTCTVRDVRPCLEQLLQERCNKLVALVDDTLPEGLDYSIITSANDGPEMAIATTNNDKLPIRLGNLDSLDLSRIHKQISNYYASPVDMGWNEIVPLDEIMSSVMNQLDSDTGLMAQLNKEQWTIILTNCYITNCTAAQLEDQIHEAYTYLLENEIAGFTHQAGLVRPQTIRN